MLSDWVAQGWLKFQRAKAPLASTYPHRKKDVADHPDLKAVQAKLAAIPDRSLHDLAFEFGVSQGVLRNWEANGWIKLQRKKPHNNGLYWLRPGASPVRPYDPTMIKVRK